MERSFLFVYALQNGAELVCGNGCTKMFGAKCMMNADCTFTVNLWRIDRFVFKVWQHLLVDKM